VGYEDFEFGEVDSTLFSQPGKGDDTLFVQFRMDYVVDRAKSLEAGRKICHDVDFVKIICPGDRLNIIDRPATPEDKARFSRQYQLFMQHKEQRADGTPLAEWPVVTRGMAEELAYLGFTTVEQLASANEQHADKIPAFASLKSKAIGYLEIAKGSSAPLEKLTEEVQNQKFINQQLQDTINAMQAQIRLLSKPEKGDQKLAESLAAS